VSSSESLLREFSLNLSIKADSEVEAAAVKEEEKKEEEKKEVCELSFIVSQKSENAQPSLSTNENGAFQIKMDEIAEVAAEASLDSIDVSKSYKALDVDAAPEVQD